MTFWFDTHAHLSDPKFDLDRKDVVERARTSGVDRIVEIADGPSEWEKAKKLSEENPGHIWWAAGLHPYYSDLSTDELWINLSKFAGHPTFVAVGEVGLDYAKCPIAKPIQIAAFEKALEIAFSINKPLIIHCRDAYDDLLPQLRRFFSQHPITSNPGVIHCFSGNLDQAQELVQMGFYLGLDAPLTYPNSKTLKLVMKEIPLEKIVLETDSPYLPPQTYRGKRNEPSYIPLIAQELAMLKNIEINEMKRVLCQTSDKLFRLNHAVKSI
jgi:TatD DNase family protein